MFRRLLAIIAVALFAPALAHAGESIKLKGPSARPNSVTYVGYDSFDADGNPVCTPCIEQRAAEAAKLQAYMERRERSRQYMARLQGNEPKPASLMAANAATLPASGATPVAQIPATPEPAVPAPANGLLAVEATPLRASMQ
ncbi:hypothetical protein [Phyllobacterium myrsinacearum]|uniref:Uncharacterized protein n=1 Tax=Phyllobacterium myrsinacearum TaxID=28101 RepID=A0A839EEW0_9HYPH|nr:hypothetical protein [Phyllobacterium myrsinacearum]MBA8876938.1 hypothetical protein [Phyllobacterium myrsinacearum]